MLIVFGRGKGRRGKPTTRWVSTAKAAWFHPPEAVTLCPAVRAESTLPARRLRAHARTVARRWRVGDPPAPRTDRPPWVWRNRRTHRLQGGVADDDGDGLANGGAGRLRPATISTEGLPMAG